MHFDALTLACIAQELRSSIAGGRVQQALLPDAHSAGLEVYAQRKRYYLLLSAQPGAGRVHLSSMKLRRGAESETPLLLLLRKYVRGAVLERIEQPDMTERVLHLHFDHPEHGVTVLVAEPMGRLSNVLLLDASGKILDCIHRAPGGENAQRLLLPGKPYSPPPPQDKAPPLDDGSANYYERLAALVAGEGLLWKALTAQVAGVSPTQAREAAWLASGDANAPAHAASVVSVAQALQTLWLPVTTGQWQPGVIEETGSVVGFSVYPVHFRGEFIPCPTASEAVERYFAAPRAALPQADAYAAARGQVAAQLRQAQQRVTRQLAALAEDEPAPGEPERLRTAAEWLLALGHTVAPGQVVLEVDVNGDGSEILPIALDDALTPVQQAERFFKRAAKLERAAEFIPQRRARLLADQDFLAQLEMDLALAENRPEIAAVGAELVAGGFVRKPARRAQQKTPRADAGILRFDSPGGFEILVGRNARQNEAITFKLTHPQDRWLHARGVPGAHVAIRSAGRPVDEATLRMAAQLAAYYSKARGERSAAVMAAERRFVQRIPGGHPGQVSVRNEETLFVAAELPKGAA